MSYFMHFNSKLKVTKTKNPWPITKMRWKNVFISQNNRATCKLLKPLLTKLETNEVPFTKPSDLLMLLNPVFMLPRQFFVCAYALVIMSFSLMDSLFSTANSFFVLAIIYFIIRLHFFMQYCSTFHYLEYLPKMHRMYFPNKLLIVLDSSSHIFCTPHMSFFH